MFCQLNFPTNKAELRAYFAKHYNRSHHHKTAKSEITYWRKLFDFPEVAEPIMQQLGIAHFDVSPRFSYQPPNTVLPEHIDIDRIVGININLMEEPATIHMRGIPYTYDAALIDVGTVPHSVEPIPTPRLVLKFAVRAPWHEVREAVLPHLAHRLDAIGYRSILQVKDLDKVKL